MNFRQRLGNRLAAYLAAPSKRDVRLPTCRPEVLAATLRKGDVLLVEGSSKFSTAVKYLTQSNWSHAALCISGQNDTEYDGVQFIEADVAEGVRLIGLDEFTEFHTRICRPVGLKAKEIDGVIAHTMNRLGHQYDLRNVFDLMRYLIHTPPVPRQWRRRMLALGSGDPTRAICSTLIASAFQSVSYPILPEIEWHENDVPDCYDCYDELLHIRHHSLFAPRDFDISPYFNIIKPSIENNFDPYKLVWADSAAEVT